MTTKVKRKYGVELEFYTDTGFTNYKRNTLLGRPKYMKEIIIEQDCSLSRGGVEVKFNGGSGKARTMARLAIMRRLVKMHKNPHGIFGETEYYGKNHDRLRYRVGESGLHVHISADGFNLCDWYRLVKLCSKHHTTICKLGNRKGTWTGNTYDIIDCAAGDINGAHLDSYWNNTYITVCNGRDTGLRYCDEYNTIEFRYGHSSLIENKKDMDSYLDFITGLMDKAMTGKKTVDLHDYRRSCDYRLSTSALLKYCRFDRRLNTIHVYKKNGKGDYKEHALLYR